jgi:hypothetical protein
MQPSDIDTSGYFLGSKWSKFESEVVARNIVRIYQFASEWAWLSWDDYQFAYPQSSWWDREWFDDVVQDFKRVQDYYFPSERFFDKLEYYRHDSDTNNENKRANLKLEELARTINYLSKQPA